jgi:hypothetical protein
VGYDYYITAKSAMSSKHRQPLFSAEESIENQQRKTELIEACASTESILVVGSGLSNRLGYPTWSELLENLQNLVLSLAKDHALPFIKPLDCDGNLLGTRIVYVNTFKRARTV